jgi:hypothetical protein
MDLLDGFPQPGATMKPTAELRVSESCCLTTAPAPHARARSEGGKGEGESCGGAIMLSLHDVSCPWLAAL